MFGVGLFQLLHYRSNEHRFMSLLKPVVSSSHLRTAFKVTEAACQR
jgi:hypothetical protein